MRPHRKPSLLTASARRTQSASLGNLKRRPKLQHRTVNARDSPCAECGSSRPCHRRLHRIANVMTIVCARSTSIVWRQAVQRRIQYALQRPRVQQRNILCRMATPALTVPVPNSQHVTAPRSTKPAQLGCLSTAGVRRSRCVEASSSRPRPRRRRPIANASITEFARHKNGSSKPARPVLMRYASISARAQVTNFRCLRPPPHQIVSAPSMQLALMASGNMRPRPGHPTVPARHIARHVPCRRTLRSGLRRPTTIASANH